MTENNPIIIDLCSILLYAPKWHLALALLREDGHEILCTSFLERTNTRQALRIVGLLEHFDDICYGYVPLGNRLTHPRQAPSMLRNTRYLEDVVDSGVTLELDDVPYFVEKFLCQRRQKRLDLMTQDRLPKSTITW